MNISATTWNSVSELLDEALDLEPAARAIWLEQLSSTRPELAPSVRKLLRAHAVSETADVMAALPPLPVRSDAARVSALASGDRVGPYSLKRELGSGGMADVWLAERADGAFTREVALKLPRINRLRRDLELRFTRERDILARLEHPHIARLYDAGVTDDGLPYLAMEYVDGQPITAYCDDKRLAISARLKLFLQVLEAVQLAHSNLIIHRDLKPSNILVAANGQVRLLDFGIAKLLADDETAKETQLTQLSGRALTPDYASPEQVKGEPLTIATDIYSLGVVLYELLAGSRPYKLKVDSAAQLEQAIVDAEPARPSNAVTLKAADARSTQTDRLTRALAGDLDTIAAKALHKQPGSRYVTAAAFGEDITRHLGGRPVHARAPTWLYRTRKLIARNKVPVGAAMGMVFVLVAATVISLWQAQLARDQASIARREATRAEAVQNFLLDIFRANSDRQADPARARNTTARDLLDLGATRIDSALQDAPEARVEVMKTLSDMYYQLQLSEQAAAIQKRRITLLKQLQDPNDVRIAKALVELAGSLHSTGQRSEILPALEEAQRILDATGDRSSVLRGNLLVQFAQRYQLLSADKMKAYADEAVSVLRPHQVPDEDRLSAALQLAARARGLLDDTAGAEPLYREAITEVAKGSTPSHVHLLWIRHSLSQTLVFGQKLDEAISVYREAIAAGTGSLGANDASVLSAGSDFASLLHAVGERNEGRQMHAEVLRRTLETRPPNDARYTPNAQMNYGISLFDEGQWPEALALIGEANTSIRRNYPGSVTLALRLWTEARVLIAMGRYDDGSARLEEGWEHWLKGAGTSPKPRLLNRFYLEKARLHLARHEPSLAAHWLDKMQERGTGGSLPMPTDDIQRDLLRAQADLQRREIESAVSSATRALDAVIASKLRPKFAALEAEAALQLGRAQLQSGDAQTARANLEQSLNLRTSIDHPISPWLAEALITLADCLLTLGDRSQAQSLIQRAASIHLRNTELGEQYKQPLRAVQQRARSPTVALPIAARNSRQVGSELR